MNGFEVEFYSDFECTHFWPFCTRWLVGLCILSVYCLLKYMYCFYHLKKHFIV